MAVPVRRENQERELICVARLRHTQGRRGEVAADILTDFPERFAAGAKFLLASDAGPASDAREYLLENAWPHKGQVILKFAGVGSISEAETLVGKLILIPKGERRQLPAGTFYLDDLIGCCVRDGEREIGHIADWEDTGGGILLHVAPIAKQAHDREVLIPFAQEICTEIDVARGVVRVRLPEGLLELNSGEPAERPQRRAAAVGGGKRVE